MFKKISYIFLLCLSIFTISLFSNFNIQVNATEQTDLIDNYLLVEPKKYSGFGCNSTCGTSREDGFSIAYQNGCKNWQVMPIISPLYKYWIDESTLSDLTDYQKTQFIKNVDEAASEWNSVRIADYNDEIVKLEKQSSNGLDVVPIRYNPQLDSGTLGQFYPVPLLHKIEIQKYDDYSTILHEFGHMIGLQDLDLKNNPGTHISLMGYANNETLHYQDIQGLAVANGKHTKHDFQKYWYDGTNYNYVCFYCDATESFSTKLESGEPLEYASSCIHKYEDLVSAGSRHWQKCTKCYKVIESEFKINVLSIDSVAVTGLIEERESVIIPSTIGGQKVIAIGENAFRNCRNLQKVVIPNTVTNIDSSAFENCSYLQSVTLPSSLVAIGSSAFKDCGSLPSIEIPNSVRYIDSNAFENCSYLQSVTLPDKITSIGNSVFKDCGSLPSIVIPNSVRYIDSNAFENCSYLQNVTLSNNLFAIGTAAFKGCGSLKSIVLPTSVEYIDNEAFSNCSSLTSVIVNRAITGITNLGENAFTGCNSNLVITVPTNRIAEYKNKEYWTSYRNKIVPSEEYTKFDIDCESSLSYSLNLDKATNKLYRLNVNCSKSYKINVISSNPVNIIIYDSNMNVINRVSNTLTQFLGFGTYYVSFEFNNVNTSGMFEIGISLTWTSTDILLSSGNNDIKNSMHLNSENVYHCNYKYLKNQGDGFYRLSLNAGSDATYPVGAIRIYTDQNRTTLLNSYGTTEINKQAITCNDENELFVFFPENYYYYIEITLPNLSYTSISLTIEKVETQDLNYQNSLATTCLDELFTNKMNNSYFKEVTISHRSKIELDIITRGTIDVDIPVYIFEKYRDPGYDPGINHYYLNLEYTASITSTNRWPVFTVILNPGTYYIGYSDNINNVSIQFALIRKVNTDLNIDGTLVADPTGNAGFTIGSEVTLNNGAFLGNTITEGFTRCLYLMVEDRLSDPMSRLQYDWYSSDESVAIVTSYGTVIAQSVNEDTEVTIYAVLKEDPSVVYRKTFTILHDTKTYETNPLDYYLTMTIEAEKIEQINLSTLNVPIDMIQYYNWSGPSLLNIDLWGNICAEPNTQGMTFEVIGTYKLNPRVKIHITVYVN